MESSSYLILVHDCKFKLLKIVTTSPMVLGCSTQKLVFLLRRLAVRSLRPPHCSFNVPSPALLLAILVLSPTVLPAKLGDLELAPTDQTVFGTVNTEESAFLAQLEVASAQRACHLLNSTLPNLVSFPGSPQFEADNEHWNVESEEVSTCSIEPETPEDVARIVRGGGHAYNVGFSSTCGVQISMVRFTSIQYDASSNTVTLGTGTNWDSVYAELEPLGFLGGGFNWKTNQVGLTIDTVVALEIVLPSGELAHVTNTKNADLFFALKGGLNGFGVVTSITYEAQPQTEVFAGEVVWDQNFSDLNKALETFDLTNTDPKAQVILSYYYLLGQRFAILTFCASIRIALHDVPILKYTVPVLEEMQAQVISVGDSLSAQINESTVFVAWSAQPFTNPFAHSRGGAYPHPPSRQVTPAMPFVAVQASAGSKVRPALLRAVKETCRKVQERAVQEGQSRWDDLLYPNYALADTPLELMYGKNVERLAEIAKKFDPKGVMRLTGGFKFQ
ncbi:FAD-binding domain-containing protein [Rickenella mellea]|uniref:FAD-binding domain-containing protein n=1 Tax=Rickenella mellea TaxID=50990 RepID=A0A4Y7QFK3_9AGAM|nr:FAD-binding domain-containing protein [Rickenella mellea]